MCARAHVRACARVCVRAPARLPACACVPACMRARPLGYPRQYGLVCIESPLGAGFGIGSMDDRGMGHGERGGHFLCKVGGPFFHPAPWIELPMGNPFFHPAPWIELPMGNP